MEFYPGFEIKPTYDPLGFVYAIGIFGPDVENRKLDDIRKSLLEPDCTGPEVIYSIAMDVGKEKDKLSIIERNLLYGTVNYPPGKLGREPIKSQGHIHAISKSCGYSTPELYEIWTGKAVIYMQEECDNEPGRCFAVFAEPGDKVIVPPKWAHCTINADVLNPMSFGAWCIRDFGFEYKGVREHNGLAWYPLVSNSNDIKWIENKSYEESTLIVKRPREYKEFLIEKDIPIYTQFEDNPGKFSFISNPMLVKDYWINFVP